MAEDHVEQRVYVDDQAKTLEVDQRISATGQHDQDLLAVIERDQAEHR